MSKYHAKAVVDASGRRFDSRREHARYLELELLEHAGVISDLQRQVPFELTIGGVKLGKYIADACYTEDGHLVVEDVKSKPTRTPVYRLKAKLMLALHGVAIREVE